MVYISDVQEVCHNEVFRATCADNEVIVIESAFYGRMRIGRCVKTDFGFIGCFQDVLKVGKTIERVSVSLVVICLPFRA